MSTHARPTPPKSWWLVPAVVAGALTFVALGIAGWELYCARNIEAANWVMAAGGLGIIVFSSVQLHRDARREAERMRAAGAKLKPAAWLARRMCEEGVIESDGKTMNQWLARWYAPSKVGFTTVGNYSIEILEASMRETVTYLRHRSWCPREATLSSWILQVLS